MIEFITCNKCKIQQKKENFWYGATRHKTCKYCNKKTNKIPNKFNTTTDEILLHLNKVVFDPKNNTSIFFQTQMNIVFEFLQRQSCKETEQTKHDTKCVGDEQ